MKQVNLWILTSICVVAAVLSLGFISVTSKTRVKKNNYQRWETQFVVKDSQKTAMVNTSKDTDKQIVLSEGQGYGLWITALAGKNGYAKQSDFDQMNQYYLNHRIKGTNLMSWQQIQRKKDNPNNATDGDLFVAEGLIEASKQWTGSRSTYQNEAKVILSDILKYNYNSEYQVLNVGNWVNQKGSKFKNLIRTSDIMPAQFDHFYKLTGDERWIKIKHSSLSYLKDLSEQHKSGLIPDFAWVSKDGATPVKASTVSAKTDSQYGPNACRVPFNLAQAKDSISKNLLSKMMEFFQRQGDISAGYHLNGKPANDYRLASFSTPVFYAANQKRKYQDIYQQEKYIFNFNVKKMNYYDATVMTLVGLMTF